MFHHIDHAKPQPKWKRSAHYAATTLLGVIVSYGLHAVIELWWISYAQQNGIPITWTYHFGKGLCALPPIVQYGLLALGVAGGALVGPIWWKWVYIEGRWSRSVHQG